MLYAVGEIGDQCISRVLFQQRTAVPGICLQKCDLALSLVFAGNTKHGTRHAAALRKRKTAALSRMLQPVILQPFVCVQQAFLNTLTVILDAYSVHSACQRTEQCGSAAT